MLLIRPGQPRDLGEVAAIQVESEEVSAWPVEDYLQHDFRVAEDQGRVAGFLVGRTVAPGERELMNLAVARGRRRQGVGRQLVSAFLSHFTGVVFLEVRASNQGAIGLYKSLGFQEVSVRKNYYDFPPEAAIVMKFHSC